MFLSIYRTVSVLSFRYAGSLTIKRIYWTTNSFILDKPEDTPRPPNLAKIDNCHTDWIFTYNMLMNIFINIRKKYS